MIFTEGTPDMNFATWQAKAAELLQSNQIQSGDYRYTRPAPITYEYQWLWDSCFHALAYQWLDPQMAQDELLSLIARQMPTGADAGMILHMTHWDNSGDALWGRPEGSILTQPPLIASAAERVHQRTGDQAFLQKIYSAEAAYHAWFQRRRDPDGDKLVSLIHPWETGWDASPRWDTKANPNPEETKAARHAHVKVLQEHACDAQSLGAAGHYHVEVLDFNAIRAADLEALARIARILGREAEAQTWEQEARAVQQAVMQKIAQHGGMWDLRGLDEQPIRVETSAKFVLLFGGCASPEQAAELVTELQTPRWWTPFPVPTSPTDAATFAPDHYWRGNVWLSVNWLIYSGLRRYGYTQLASQLAERSVALVAQSGFCEYYNPLTGAGHGPTQQSWSTIIVDMLATEQGEL